MQEERSATGRHRVYHLLDAIRGLAAIAVMQRHVAMHIAIPLNATFLAVDLFFALSGFVIAHAYETRLLEGASRLHFFAIRVVRLYPLYILGTAIGLIEMTVVSSHFDPSDSSSRIAFGTILAIFMLPALGFPVLNAPRWSLFYELVVNAFHSIIVRWLTPFNILIVIGVSGLVLEWLLISGAHLASGWEIADVPVGLARVGYSYFAGVLCYRIQRKVAGRWCVAAWLGISVALSLGAVVFLPLKTAAELVVVFIGFPILVFVGALFDVRGVLAKICAFLGVASYAIYVTHLPLGLLAADAMGSMGLDPAGSQVWAFLFLALILALSWLLDRYYDKPVRAYLGRWVRPLKPSSRLHHPPPVE